jgi:hypothetical protein
LDGDQAARLVARGGSEAPDGRGRWTLQLRADQLVELAVVESIDPAPVCRTLTKTTARRG